MGADVINIQEVVRSQLPSAHDAAFLDGYRLALVHLKTLNRCVSLEETRVSMENWLACGELSESRYAAISEYYGFQP